MRRESSVRVSNVAIKPTVEETEERKVKRVERLSKLRIMVLGVALIAAATIGFYYIPGMIDKEATGSHLVNSFYCAVMTLTTVGFGDICPSSDISVYGKAFIIVIAFAGLGMFCGPVMDLAASWSASIPGGIVAVATLTIAIGVVLFTSLEQSMTQTDAAYMSVIAGTSIGYGDVTPDSNEGKIAVALYTILVSNVIGGLLQPARDYLESLCLKEVEVDSSKKEG